MTINVLYFSDFNLIPHTGTHPIRKLVMHIFTQHIFYLNSNAGNTAHRMR